VKSHGQFHLLPRELKSNTITVEQLDTSTAPLLQIKSPNKLSLVGETEDNISEYITRSVP
jgi:hypothetical protein